MFAYEAVSSEARTIAADLGVRYVLEGSVRTAGKRVRVIPRVIDIDSWYKSTPRGAVLPYKISGKIDLAEIRLTSLD
jgi:TolB-like protein